MTENTKEKTRNLCAQVPESLHQKMREEQEAAGLTLSQYVTKVLKEYYEKGGKMNMGETRTLAVQVPAELFERLDEYLAKNKLKKKDFIIGLIQKALAEAEAAETEG